MLGFQTRCRNGGAKSKDGEQESPSRGSLGTSVEVQTGNSVEVYSIQGENSAAHHRAQQKAQALKLKVYRKQLFHSILTSYNCVMLKPHSLKFTGRLG